MVAQVGTELTYWSFGLGLVLFAASMGLAGTPSATAITESLPETKQGVASAVSDTARELGSVLNQQYRDGTALLAPASRDSGVRVTHGVDATHD